MSESARERRDAAPLRPYAYVHVRRIRAMYTKEQFTRERSSFVRSFVRSLVRVYICVLRRDAHPRAR